jgi:hypothetical protein
MPLSHDACGIAVDAQIARYLAASSAHPDGAAGMIESGLAAFADDVNAHRGRGRCRHRAPARSFPIPDLG